MPEWNEDERVIQNLDAFVSSAYEPYGDFLNAVMGYADPTSPNWVMVFALGKWMRGYNNARAEGYDHMIAMQSAMNSVLADPAFSSMMSKMMGQFGHMVGGGQ